MSHVADPPPLRPSPAWLRDLGLGAVFWLAFLLLLEPGNVIPALDAGRPLAWEREALRIAGATALGASVTPGLLWLVRTFPVASGKVWPRLALQVGVSVLTAAALVLIANPLAAWVLGPETRPLAVALRQDLAADWALLTCAIGLMLAIAQVVQLLGRSRPLAETAWLTSVIVPLRGRQSRLAVGEIDWIETQGNYLALHVGAATHLIRETSRSFEARLEPARFIRIHRRTIVAADRMRSLTLLDGGDAELELEGGAVLRVSRSYRRQVQDRLKTV